MDILKITKGIREGGWGYNVCKRKSLLSSEIWKQMWANTKRVH